MRKNLEPEKKLKNVNKHLEINIKKLLLTLLSLLKTRNVEIALDAKINFIQRSEFHNVQKTERNYRFVIVVKFDLQNLRPFDFEYYALLIFLNCEFWKISCFRNKHEIYTNILQIYSKAFMIFALSKCFRNRDISSRLT